MLFHVTWQFTEMTEDSEPRELAVFAQWQPPAEADFKAFYNFADNSGGVAILEVDAPQRSPARPPRGCRGCDSAQRRSSPSSRRSRSAARPSPSAHQSARPGSVPTTTACRPGPPPPPASRRRTPVDAVFDFVGSQESLDLAAQVTRRGAPSSSPARGGRLTISFPLHVPASRGLRHGVVHRPELRRGRSGGANRPEGGQQALADEPLRIVL